MNTTWIDVVLVNLHIFCVPEQWFDRAYNFGFGMTYSGKIPSRSPMRRTRDPEKAISSSLESGLGFLVFSPLHISLFTWGHI